MAHDLAARLYYVLWSTTPDQELRSLADKGSLPNGQKFSNIIDYKKLLLEKETLFRRNLATRLLTHATRLLTHATGRHIEPLDRPIIDEIVTSKKTPRPSNPHLQLHPVRNLSLPLSRD